MEEKPKYSKFHPMENETDLERVFRVSRLIFVSIHNCLESNERGKKLGFCYKDL